MLAVHEQSVDVITRVGETITLPWDQLDWARAYVDAERQGRAPQTAGEILRVGDHILLRPYDDAWRLAQIPRSRFCHCRAAPSRWCC